MTFSNEVNVITAYFSDAKSRPFKNMLRDQTKPREAKQNLFFTPLNTNKIHDNSAINTLLNKLNIPTAKQTKYYQRTLYDLLTRLSRKGYTQADYLIQRVHAYTTTPLWIKNLLYVSAGTLSILALLLTAVYVPAFHAWINSVFIFPNCFPWMGLIFTCLFKPYWLYQDFKNTAQPHFQRRVNSIMGLLRVSAEITTYILWGVAHGVITPLIAGLFIAQSTIDVIKEGVLLIRALWDIKNLKAQNTQEINEKRDNLRPLNGACKRRNTAIIRLTASVALTGIMAAWCLLPAGLLVMLLCGGGMGLVYGVQSLAVKVNDNLMKRQLKTQLGFASVLSAY